MAEEYVISLLGLVGTLGAVVALAWAIRRHQLRAGDQAMYEAMADDEPEYVDHTSAPVPRMTRWLFAAALTFVFLLITWLVVQTVRIGTRTAAPPPPLAQRLPSSE